MIQSDYCVVFDLDDTLYKEIDFLKSAYIEIANHAKKYVKGYDVYDWMINIYRHGENVFQKLEMLTDGKLAVSNLLEEYRNHYPTIELDSVTIECLNLLEDRKVCIGIITDGRSITQWNKISALGLDTWINKDFIVISEDFGTEKPDSRNYTYFEKIMSCNCFMYVGDNIKKDFVAPNYLKWKTCCLLDDGRNIHKQDFSLPKEYLPSYCVKSIIEIVNLL